LGLLNGLVIVSVKDLLSSLSQKQLQDPLGQKRKSYRWKWFLSSLVGGIIAGLLSILFLELITGFADVIVPLFIDLFNSIVVGLMIVRMRPLTIEKKPLEMMVWLWANTWRKLLKGEALRNGLLVGLLTGETFAGIGGTHHWSFPRPCQRRRCMHPVRRAASIPVAWWLYLRSSSSAGIFCVS